MEELIRDDSPKGDEVAQEETPLEGYHPETGFISFTQDSQPSETECWKLILKQVVGQTELMEDESQTLVVTSQEEDPKAITEGDPKTEAVEIPPG